MASHDQNEGITDGRNTEDYLLQNNPQRHEQYLTCGMKNEKKLVRSENSPLFATFDLYCRRICTRIVSRRRKEMTRGTDQNISKVEDGSTSLDEGKGGIMHDIP